MYEQHRYRYGLGIVGFNVPLDTLGVSHVMRSINVRYLLIRHFADDFTSRMTQPTVSLTALKDNG